MTRTSETGWMPERENRGHDTPVNSGEDIGLNQRGKPVKTVIGVVLLVVLALALSRMHPVPHEISDPSGTAGQVTGTNTR